MDEESSLKYFGRHRNFVYYNSLQETHPKSYNTLIARRKSGEFHNDKMLKTAAQLEGWARYEGQKEAKMLSDYFGANFNNIDSYDLNYGKELIEAINSTLQFKDMYNRYITRIIGPEGREKGTGKITVASMFPSYLQSTLFKKIKKSIENQKALNANFLKKKPENILNALELERLVDEAVEETFFKVIKESGDWSKSDQNKGMQKFFTELNKMPVLKNRFLKQINKLYHIEDFKQELRQTIINDKKLLNTKTIKASKYLKIKSDTYKHGTLAEYLGEYAAAVAAQVLGQDGINVQTSSLGVAGGRPDYTLGIGLDEKIFQEIIDELGTKHQDRIETVTKAKEISQKLANVKEGFLIYTNVKDYTLGGNFSGFSAGSEMSLGDLSQIISHTPGGSMELIASIMSTMEKAIYSDKKDEIENEVASKMAYFLFDDVTTIGQETKASEHSIHLMLLDGIYIPLSYMFFLMARAIRETSESESKVRKIFNVSIVPGEIAYENGPWGMEKWLKQREIALEQIKISAKFLKSFIDIVREVKGR